MSAGALLWGIFWRSVVRYTIAGAVLGSLYGCSLVTTVFLFLPAVLTYEVESWDSVMLVLLVMAILGCLVGAIGGWKLARNAAGNLRPLAGAMVGALIGASCMVVVSLPHIFAFMVGAAMGAAYGLAVGLANGLSVAVLTRVRHFPPTDISQYRYFAMRFGPVLVGALAVLALIVLAILAISGDLGSSLNDEGGILFIALTFVVFPALVLGLIAEWVGRHLADWYERTLPATPQEHQETEKH